MLESSNFSFLSRLEEVTDHILLLNVKIPQLVIPSLRIIGGRNPLRIAPPGTNQAQNYAVLFLNCTIDQIILPRLTYIESNTVGVQIDTDDISDPSDIFKGLLDSTTGCNLYGVNWREIVRNTDIIFRIDIQTLSSVPPETEIINLSSDCNQTLEQSQCIACIGGACWNQTECQVLTSAFSGHCVSCEPVSGCYNLETCCDPLCLGGCSGPGPDQCYGCKQLDNNNTCVSECPPKFIFNPITLLPESNPDGRLQLDKFCVAACPTGYSQFDRECVERCPDTFTTIIEDNIQICEFCGTGCPKECNGTEVLPDAALTNSTAHLFENCTRVNGNLIINTESYEDVTANELRYLESITEITGIVLIQSTPANIPIFTFFRNLRTIQGNNHGVNPALGVAVNNFEYIDLSQLQSVDAGTIFFANNNNLCYLANLTTYTADNLIFVLPSYPDNPNCTCDEECQPVYRCWGPGPTHCGRCKKFLNDRECVRNCSGIENVYSDFESKTCRPCNTECVNCTDPTPFTCAACRNFKNDDECVRICPINHFGNEENICIDCNPVCTLGCTGPNTTISQGGCNLCERIVLDGDENQVGCIPDAACPELSFERVEVVVDALPAINISDRNIRVCRPCHSLCQTCDGKELGDCLSCKYFEGTNGECVESCNAATEYGFQKECRTCDPECIGCTGGTARNCLSCKNANHEGECVERCPILTYQDTNSDCSPCHSSCETCEAAGEYNCTTCGISRLLTTWTANNATCTVDCFDGFFMNARECSRCGELCLECTSLEDCTLCKYVRLENGTCARECPDNFQLNNLVCTPNPNSIFENLDRFKFYIIAAFIFGLFVIIGSILCFFICICVYLRYLKTNKIKVNEELENPTYGMLPNGRPGGFEMNTLATESSVRYSLLRAGSQESIAEADMTQLAIANLSNIEKQDALGKGAFGIVYRGIWRPREGEEVTVAIKELNEDAPIEDMQELIKEAVLLAKMRHKYLVQFYCLCMARQLMIINELVSGGSLLDYLKKEQLTSKTRLTFMYQIASGMNYLESRRLVHRDLAARNCLVASEELVKISDFGLSRILDVGENQYISSGGKIPVRWMPLESIFYKHYSHKSDVWSYGVTAWEILTSAKRPYGNIKPQEVIEMLVAGERMGQPVNCSTDIYSLLRKCWVDKPEDRISFDELKTQLHDMLNEAELFVFPSEDERAQFGSSGYSTIPDYEEIDEEMMAYLVTTQVQILVREAINGKKGTMNYENLREHRSEPVLQEVETQITDGQTAPDYMVAGKITTEANLNEADNPNPYSLAQDFVPLGIEVYGNAQASGTSENSPPESGISDYLLADDLTKKLKESTSFSNPHAQDDNIENVLYNSQSQVLKKPSSALTDNVDNEYMLSSDVTNPTPVVNEYLMTRSSGQRKEQGIKDKPIENSPSPDPTSPIPSEYLESKEKGLLPSGYLESSPIVKKERLPSEYIESKPDPTSPIPSEYLESSPIVKKERLPSEYIESKPDPTSPIPSEYLESSPIVKKERLPSEYLESSPIVKKERLPSEYLESKPDPTSPIPSEYLESSPIVKKERLPSEYLESSPIVKKERLPSEYLESKPDPTSPIPSEYLESKPDPTSPIPSEYLESSPIVKKERLPSEYLESKPDPTSPIPSEYLESSQIVKKEIVPSEYLESSPIVKKERLPLEYLQSGVGLLTNSTPSEYLQSVPIQKGVSPSEYLNSDSSGDRIAPSEYLKASGTLSLIFML